MAQPLRRFDVLGPLPHDERTMLYEMVSADSAIGAVHRVQADALGCKAVRLTSGRLVFADPADRAWAAGRWRVEALASNAAAKAVMIEIPAVDSADGQQAA